MSDNTESTVQVFNYTGALPTFSTTPSADTAVEQLNDLVTAIEGLFNQVSNQIAGITNKSAVVVQQVPLAEASQVGSLVYYDKDNAVYAPALAGLLGEPGTQGQSVETPASRVVGMVIERYDNQNGDTNNIVGTLLLGGMWTSVAAATACLGAGATPGTYYLSPYTAGMATLDPGTHLRQPVLTYMGQGQFSLNMFYMAHDNHWHGSITLGNHWTAWTAEDTNPNKPATRPRVPADSDTGTVQTGAWMWYDTSEDLDALGIGDLSQRTTAVFMNGLLQISDNILSAGFYIDYGKLWYKGNTAPGGNIVLFNHFPFAYGSPVIRDVESTNDALTLYKRNGLVQMTMNDFVVGSTVRNPYAMSAITGRTITRTPVITGLAAGPGTDIQVASNGIATISNKSAIGYPMDAYNVNVNGATVTSDGIWTYFMFPKGRAGASLIINMPITGIGSDTVVKVSVWGWGVGASATFDTFIYTVPDSYADGNHSLPGVPQASIPLSFSGGSLLYAETGDGVEMQGSGMAFARVQLTAAPASDVRLMRLGFKLTVVSAPTVEPAAPTVDGVTQVINTLTAAESIQAYQCVRATGNGLYRCRSAYAAEMAGYVGVATASANAGASCTYISQGVLTGLSGLSAGAPVYVGTDGSLTMSSPQSAPSAQFIKQVGVAISPSMLQVQPTVGVLK